MIIITNGFAEKIIMRVLRPKPEGQQIPVKIHHQKENLSQ